MKIVGSTYSITVFVSIVVGMWIAIGMGQMSDIIPLGKSAKTSIEECQKDLRRDEYCTIIAVPTDEVEGD